MIVIYKFKVNELKVFRYKIMLLTILLLDSCSKEESNFSAYDSAIEYIQSHYSALVMIPSSSDIHRVEYYVSSPDKWLVIYLKSDVSKGRIYQKFPMSKWKEWNKAFSKGSWYHENLRGDKEYFFKLSK